MQEWQELQRDARKQLRLVRDKQNVMLRMLKALDRRVRAKLSAKGGARRISPKWANGYGQAFTPASKLFEETYKAIADFISIANV